MLERPVRLLVHLKCNNLVNRVNQQVLNLNLEPQRLSRKRVGIKQFRNGRPHLRWVKI